MDHWNTAWLVIVVIFAGGLVVSKLTEKPRIPDVTGFLLLGILLGPAILNWISEPSQSEVNQFILNFGATLILFDGGRTVQLTTLKKVWVSLTLLVTVGVVITTLIVGTTVHYLLNMPWLWSFLLAAVLAPTDPATLIPVFKRVPILDRLQQTMETESAFNDATGSVLVMTLLAAVSLHGAFHFGSAIGQFFHDSIIGLVVGFVLGLIGLWTVSEKGWGIFHEFPSVTLFVIALASFECAETFHASGLMAAFAAGVVTGNGWSFGFALSDGVERKISHFGNVMTVMLRMLIFVLLGTQVNFTVVGQYLWVGLVIVVIFMFIARPLTVVSSVLVDRNARWSWREIGFMMWVRETGVIPAALTGMLVANRLNGSEIVSAVVFLAILCTLLIQATSTGWVAKRLGVSKDVVEEDL